MRDLAVFDLDGTIRDGSHRLYHILREPSDDRPKEWGDYNLKVGGDLPIMHIVNTAISFREMGLDIAFWTGATEMLASRAITMSWLRDHGLTPYFELRMREEGDHRPDYELKLQWLEETRRNLDRVHMAFEDRKSVVDMYRANGVLCVQVAPGDF